MFRTTNPKPIKRRKYVIHKKILLSDLIVIVPGMSLTIVMIALMFPTNYIMKFSIGIIPLMTSGILIIPFDENNKLWNILILFMIWPFQKRRYKRWNISNLIPFAKVEEGLIHLKNKKCAMPIKINGFNFTTLSEDDQRSVLEGYRNFLKQMEYEFSILAMDMPIDYEAKQKYLDSLKRKDNKALWDLLNFNLNNIKRESHKEEKTFYILVYGYKEKLLEDKSRIFNGLDEAKLEAEVLSDEEIMKMLNLNYFRNEKNQVMKIKNLITKEGVKFHWNYMKINNKYVKIIAVNSYTSESSLGWMYPLSNMDGVNFTINIERYNLNKAIKKINKAAADAEGKYQETLRMSEEVESRKEAEVLYELMQDIQNESEILFSTYSYFVITADTHKELSTKIKSFKANMGASRIKINRLICKQKDGLDAVLPKTSHLLKKITSIELPASSIANGFPFYQDGLNDQRGIYIGYTENYQNVFFDPFKANEENKSNIEKKNRVNSNITVLATSGGGKTTLLSSLISKQWVAGTKIMIIDPQSEYIKLTRELDGRVLDMNPSPNSKDKINPLEFMKNSESNTTLGEHMMFLQGFIKIIFPALLDIQIAELIKIITNIYRKRKITFKTKSKDFPIFRDVYEEIAKVFKKVQKEGLEPWRINHLYTLKTFFERFTDDHTPESIMWNHKTNIDISKIKITTFDIKSIARSDDRLSNAQYFLLIKFCNTQMFLNKDQNLGLEREKQQKIMIIADEAHKLINEKAPAGVEFLYDMSKTIRKFNGSLVTATQQISDLLSGSDYISSKASAVINNSQYLFLGKMQRNDLNKLIGGSESSIADIGIEEQDYISKASQSKFLFVVSTLDRKKIQHDVTQNEINIWKHAGEL